MCSIKIQTENSRENTNAAPALPIGNTSALRASRGVHNKSDVCNSHLIANNGRSGVEFMLVFMVNKPAKLVGYKIICPSWN